MVSSSGVVACSTILRTVWRFDLTATSCSWCNRASLRAGDGYFFNCRNIACLAASLYYSFASVLALIFFNGLVNRPFNVFLLIVDWSRCSTINCSLLLSATFVTRRLETRGSETCYWTIIGILLESWVIQLLSWAAALLVNLSTASVLNNYWESAAVAVF